MTMARDRSSGPSMQEAEPKNTAERVASALGRRAGYAWRRLRNRMHRPAVPAALDWLVEQVQRRMERQEACPALVEAALPVLASYGAWDVANEWGEWLLARNAEHGNGGENGRTTAESAKRAAGTRFWRRDSEGEIAQGAIEWYRTGQRERADRAMAWLTSRQLRSGGFRGRVRYAGKPDDDHAGLWTAVRFLEAARLQVQAAFESDTCTLPDKIDAADGRLLAVRDWFQSLGPRAAVADVGCGPGRFIQHLADWFPEAKLTGIDPSARLLACLPSGVERRVGDLLNAPAADGQFDGAMAVESLEHSLLPERAIGELCRIVRPGGRVLVIDKNIAKQPLSRHEPWEQWFEGEQVARWLGRNCQDVETREVAHGTELRSSGLFFCWTATRRQ